MKRISIVGLLTALALTMSQAAQAGRTLLNDPGEAEVIAGTGYKHTLFDSADNKCQHCHNDLYDTWNRSMHAKSWEDPIFQSKYQDFLRLQASKIGVVDPRTGNEYKPGMIQKTGQVCIKCHAPTAYYSGDFKITLTPVGDQDTDPDAYKKAKGQIDGYDSLEENLAPAYKPELEATVVSMARTGAVYTVSYHIGHKHNQEGINCAFCHSVETVRLMNDGDAFPNGDGGEYALKNPIKMGPIGPIVHHPSDGPLVYNADASDPDMNKFFALIGPEKYIHFDSTPKSLGEFDTEKMADGRYTMKSVETTAGCDNDPTGPAYETECTPDILPDGTPLYFTGGPFYGPFGVTGLSNSRDDDASDRESLVKAEFQTAVEAEHGDKFDSKHQFAAYGKALCLSCHQRSSLMLNPESDGDPGIEVEDGVHVGDDQFLELCSTWTAMSDGVGNNFEDTDTSPKCQRCHMEPLEKVTDKDGEVKNAVVLHQWDQPDVLFTSADTKLTHHFLPPIEPDNGTEGPVAEGYLNNHAFMGANTADFGTTKIVTGFKTDMEVTETTAGKLKIETYVQNKTAHMFPGAHPMRRFLTRMVLYDANGDRVPFATATGKSKFKTITNKVAKLEGNIIKPGFKTVKVKYDKDSDVVIQGYTPDLDGKRGEPVSSQFMDAATLSWVSPDATVGNSEPVCAKTDSEGDCTSWVIKGTTTVKKITDIEGIADHFTRIYGRETGKRASDGTHVVRPGFDSNIASDNRLKPNEREHYAVTYDTTGAVYPLTARYEAYYLKKGGNGKFGPLTEKDGFLVENPPKKAAIYKVFGKQLVID